MPIPWKLEYVIWRVSEAGAPCQLLRAATGRRLPAHEAWRAWPEVLEHKWLLSERLGRDVGLRVAAVDYFDNLKVGRRSPFPNGTATAQDLPT